MKRFILAVLLGSSLIPAFAQSTEEEDFKKKKIEDAIYVLLSIGYSRHYGKDVHNAEFLLGYDFGVGYRLRLRKQLYFDPEIDYCLRGSKFKVSQESFSERTGYLDAPMNFEYDVCEPDIYIESGPRVGYLLSAKQKDGTSTDIKDFFHKVDFGWDVGGGYKITERITIYTLEYIGLTCLFKSGGTARNLDFTVGTRVNF